MGLFIYSYVSYSSLQNKVTALVGQGVRKPLCHGKVLSLEREKGMLSSIHNRATVLTDVLK